MGNQFNTMLGPIEGGKIGKTLMHEHFVFAFPGHEADRTLGGFDFDAALQRSIEVANVAKRYGVETIIDVTPNDCGREPLLYKAVQEATGVNIGCVTGLYFESSGAPAYFNFRAALGDAVEEIYEMFVAELTVGIEDTGIKAQMIKVGTSENVITDYEKMVFKAAARASRDTGAVVLTHTDRGTMGPAQADLFLEEGADPARIIIGHMCGNTDLRYVTYVLDKGFNIAFDRWGYNSPMWGTPLDIDREAMTFALLARGYADRIFWSHDTVNYGKGRQAKAKPGEPPPPPRPIGVGRLFEVLIPEMKAMGLSDDQVEQILVRNPARLFG